MESPNLSIGDMASALGGAGLTMLTTDILVASGLIAAAVGLKVLVAYLNKSGIEVSTPPGLG